ncbi:MAG: aspartate kinase [Eubacteriales bacterium]|nr:aspartate kinase [Clostridiales bacterium]MDD2440833.1 aspartate kinase [Eubacteriales bacterium]MDD4138637.1 aspartate kinase [Eubacteriales bacterium]MDD4743529.1 aspartate kinase [Eubacteriales bacterium]
MYKVCKFGGSSLANAEQIRKVCDIMLSDPSRRVMVVSAPGKRTREDTKVTDLLIALANARISGYDGAAELQDVLDRFGSIAAELELDAAIMADISLDMNTRLCQDCSNSLRFMDSIKAAGEDNCARLVAGYLKSIGRTASYVDPRVAGMFLTEEYGNAQVLPEAYPLLARLRQNPGISVFPGFFGYSKSGQVVTFSRGGSDITGSILAAATEAQTYENWTDVDSVYSVNPALISNPHPIMEITYDEMRELAYAGFTVLHEEALLPAYRKGIPVNIRNTNNPTARGTMIVRNRVNFDGVVTGIAGAKGFCSLNMSKYLMNREVGFALKVLQILADEQISFEHMPSGIDSLSIIMRKDYFTPDKEKIITGRLVAELGIEKVSVNRNLAIVIIVGEAMARTVGVTARAANALSKAGVNLEIINQGSSEISVMFGVREEYCNYAVKELYKEFFQR